MPSIRLPIICLMLSLFYSCKKNDVPSNIENSGYASTTPSSPVYTNLVAYAYDNNQLSNPLQIFTIKEDNRQELNYQNPTDGFHTNGFVQIDKYQSYIAFRNANAYYDLGFLQYKSFPAISEIKNYSGFKYSNFNHVGHVRNLGDPVTLNLPGNGKLFYPTESFSSIGSDINYNIFVAYTAPWLADYAVSLPALPFADIKSKRFFMDSYGVVQIRKKLTYCNCSIIKDSEIYNKEVTLQLPIPTDRLNSAPDRIDSWHLNDYYLKWEKKGVAYKKNGFYEKKIKEQGIWNFAIPIDAVYLTLQLRTTTDFAIPNTRFIVNNNVDEIAEGRTDAEGNAFILIPANKSLSFNIINDHFFNYLNIQLPDQGLGLFSKEAVKKIVLSDRSDIATLEGNVYKCDGTSFDSGFVVISQSNARDEYVVPISKGKFKTANWINYAWANAKLSFYHPNGNTAFEVNTFLGSNYITHSKRLKENFYACPDASQLYCNYQIDSANHSIVGNINSVTPRLIAKREPGVTEIFLQDGNKGISFSMVILGLPNGMITSSPGLVINGVNYNYNQNGTTELTIYRNDGYINGFMEGWFGVDYLDAQNKPHRASGNFRVKITN